MVASLKRVRYSLNDSDRPWCILNKLVTKIFLWRIEGKLCSSFFTISWQLLMDEQGKLIYHLRVVPLMVLDSSLHFRESGAPIMAICVFMEATCLYGSMSLLNMAREGGFKSSRTSVHHISFDNGWGLTIPSPSGVGILYVFSNVVDVIFQCLVKTT